MFKIDFMSSLRENTINGFDLAVMEQIEQENEEEVDLEELEESSEEEDAEDLSDYEDSSYLDWFL